MTLAADLKVRVIPNAKKNEFGGYREGELVLRLTAPAFEGKANKAAVDFLARFVGCPDLRFCSSGEKAVDTKFFRL